MPCHPNGMLASGTEAFRRALTPTPRVAGIAVSIADYPRRLRPASSRKSPPDRNLLVCRPKVAYRKAAVGDGLLVAEPGRGAPHLRYGPTFF